MPHLSQLQREYRDQDFTIIGLTSGDRSNTLEAVQAMVEEKGDGMDYTVAWDTERETNKAYMEASGARGIPTSFLVDQKGNVAWIGHPGNADLPIAYVLGGKWDYVEGPEMMKQVAKDQRAIVEANRSDSEKALELLVQFEKDYPIAAKGLDSLRFSVYSKIPAKSADAERVGRALIESAVAANDPVSLNQFAWELVDPTVSLDNRFLDLALLAANHANELTEESDAAILDTVARVHFWRGDLEKALTVQRRAVECAEGRMKEDLEKVVEEYEEALEPQTSS